MNKFFLSLYFCCATVLMSLLVVTSFHKKIQDKKYPLIKNFHKYTAAKIKINQLPGISLTRTAANDQWKIDLLNNPYFSKSKILKFMDLLPTLSSKFERGEEVKNAHSPKHEYALSIELQAETAPFLLLKLKFGKEIEALRLPEARSHRLAVNKLQNWNVQDFFVTEISPLWPFQKPQNIHLITERKIELRQKNQRYTFVRPYNGYFADPLLFEKNILLLQQPLKFENVFYHFPDDEQFIWTNWQFFSQGKKLNLALAADKYGTLYLRYNGQQETLVVHREWQSFTKRTAFELLDKQIFTAPLKQIREIEFQHNQQYFRARSFWHNKKLLYANFEGLPLNQGRLEQYFQQISQLRYEQALEQRFYPSGVPQAALRYRLANGETHYIAFYSHPSPSYYAVSFDRLRPYFLAPSYQFTRLQATALAMMLRP